MKIPEPRKTQNGVWEIVNTVSEVLEADDPGIRRIAMHMGGQPHLKAHSLAVRALYYEDGLEGVDLTLNALAVRKAPVTVLICGNSGGVEAREGRVVPVNDELALMQKGSSSKGHYINDMFRPLEVAAGYSKQQAMAESWWVRAAAVPETVKVDYTGVPEYSGEPEELISAAYLLDYPDFDGGTVPGCLFLATDVQSEDNIVNGYLWVPDGCALTSEHGSQYMNEMTRLGGRIKDFTPGDLTFRQCLNDEIPGTRREAYAFLLHDHPVPA